MISVIIPAKDAQRTLSACLEAVDRQTGFQKDRDYEVIVVDDGSSDETAEIAARWKAKVIRQANAGPASARNHGARVARGDILAFTDADCAPAPDWLINLTRPFSDPRIVGVKGIYRTRQTGIVPRFVQLEYETKYQRMQRLASIDFIDTYSAAYRKSVFLDNDGFDVSFPVPSVEDQEFSFRLARKGYTMVFAPRAAVYHQHDNNLAEYFRRKFNIGYWKAFMLRWLPEKTFDDSHTLPSQRWQILLAGLILITLALAFIWPWIAWLSAGLTAAFYITASQTLIYSFKHDRGLLLPALVLIAIRAIALGTGLAAGLVLAGQKKTTPKKQIAAWQRIIKRFFDILLSILGILITLPLFPIIAAAIRIDTRGPVLYLQKRAGQFGKPFQLYKFRTMVFNADQQLCELLDPNDLKEPVYKLRNDPRITRVGKFLRRWSLDEIPQLWNVLRGEMSLVGPRPEETWLVERYTDTQRQRLMVKPGLTGPMQISGRGELDFQTRFELEMDYILNYSLRKDLAILLKSIPSVILGVGAF